MKAAVLHRSREISYEEVPTPVPEAGEVLVKVSKSGICGSDIPRLLHDGAHYYPIILGHEFSGTIAEVGKGTAGLKPGDRISCAPLVPNFDAPESRMGNYSLGAGYSFIGSRRQGGLAEYVAIPEGNAVRLPEGVSLTDGVFFEPLTVSLHALNIMRFRGGSTVAITGMGTIGLLALQAVRSMGALSVTVFDIDDRRLATASTLGADSCFNTGDPEFESRLAEIMGRGGFEVCLETAGVPYTEILCLRLAAAKGFVMYIGTPHVPLTLAPHEFELINRKELLVSGSWMNYSAPFPGKEWEWAADLFSRRKIETAGLIDREIPLSEIVSAVRDLAISGKVQGKILVSC